MSDKPTLYSTVEAAAYLGIAVVTLKHYLYDFDPPLITPDYVVGRELAFREITLDNFKASQWPDGYTVDEAAVYLGVKRTWVHYHVYISKKLIPDGQRGKSHIFTQSTLDAAKSLIK